MASDSSGYLSNLHDQFEMLFNLEEVKMLCFDLGVDIDNVAGDTKGARIRELILQLARDDRLPELLALVRTERSHADWADPPADFALPESLATAEAVPPAHINYYGPVTFNQQGQIVEGPQVNAGRDVNVDHLGDNIQGDKVEGDKIVYQGLTIDEVAILFVELKTRDQPKVWDGCVPYRGLMSFQESDAEFFFGREALVDDLLARVETSSFIVLAGPSGSGKSSVARAGLFHALRQDSLPKSKTWLLWTMRPAMKPEGGPLENLALVIDRAANKLGAGDFIRANGLTDPLALHKSIEVLLSDDRDQRFVLLVDQFEEVFTQNHDEPARLAFINQLTAAAEAPNSRAVIIVALRADFVSNCADFPDLRRLMSKQFQLVGALDPKDLATAITLPALKVGAVIDPALVKQIIDEMKGEPGALPLMSFALQDLFNAEKTAKGKPMDMTLKEYVQRGGINSALKRHADEVFAHFTAEQQVLARGIFSRLIEVGQGRVDTRRTVAFDELVPAGADPALVAATVAKLAEEKAWLLTTSGKGDAPGAEGLMTATVTIAHEKLIDAWPWLKELVAEHGELIALRNRIEADARAWTRSNEDDGYLYTGARLILAQEDMAQMSPDLNRLSKRFLSTSVEKQEARQRQRDELFRLEAIKLLLKGGQLAVASGAELQRDPELALLLATTAFGLGEPLATTAALYTAFDSSYRGALYGHNGLISSSAFSPDGQRIVTASADKTARVWDLDGNELAQLTGHSNSVASAVFSPDGQRIVTASADRTARVWDLDGNELAQLAGHSDSLLSVVFSPDGQHIVTASFDRTARVWDLDGNELAQLTGHSDWVTSAVLSSDGQHILTAGADRTARVWDVDGNELAQLAGHSNSVTSAAFSPDGQRIVTTSADRTAWVWDVDGNELARLARHSDSVTLAVFSPDGQHIVTASKDGTARVWDLEGKTLAQLAGHSDSVLSAVFSPDGQRIVTAGTDKTARVWDVNGNELAQLAGHSNTVFSAIFSPDGQRIVTTSTDRTARVWRAPPALHDVLACVVSRLHRGFSDDECHRYFREEPQSCPRTVEEVFALLKDKEDLGSIGRFSSWSDGDLL